MLYVSCASFQWQKHFPFTESLFMMIFMFFARSQNIVPIWQQKLNSNELSVYIETESFCRKACGIALENSNFVSTAYRSLYLTNFNRAHRAMTFIIYSLISFLIIEFKKKRRKINIMGAKLKCILKAVHL